MKIAIVKLSSLGDIVQALPVAAYLKERYPNCTISWVVDRQFSALASSCSFIDEVIELPLRAWKKERPNWSCFRQELKKLRLQNFDHLFDLQGNCKSAFVTSLMRAENKVGFGHQLISEWPALLATHFHFDPHEGSNIRNDYLQVVQKYFQDRNGYQSPPILLKTSEEEVKKAESFFTEKTLRIVLAAGSQWANKELQIEALSAFVRKLDKSFTIEWLFTSGTPREKQYADALAQNVKKSRSLHLPPLPFLQHVMKRAHLLIAVDSLPLHLAALGGVQTFSFFGPSAALKYAPQGHLFVQGHCPYNSRFTNRCERLRKCPTGACMKEMNLDDQFMALSHFLAQVKGLDNV